VAAAWLYFCYKGLLADVMGSGKTATVLAVLAMCKMHGELGLHNRAVIVCKPVAVGQWAEQARRLLPGISVLEATGTPQQRTAGYLGGWEVAIVSDRTFAPARSSRQASRSRDGDYALLQQFPVGTLVFDDLDALRNPATRAAYAINKLAEDCSRVIAVHGTPLQKKPTELWSFLRPLGGMDVLGPLGVFKQRFVTQKSKWLYVPAMVCPEDHLTPPPYRTCRWEIGEKGSGVFCGKPCRPDQTGRKALRQLVSDGGINPDRLEEFRIRIAPFVMRRTAADLDDVELPGVVYDPVWVDLLPEQRRRYDDLKRDVLRLLRSSGEEEITHMKAQQRFIRGWQICSGTASLDGARGDVSVKLDWVVDKLTGDLDGEKVVCFVYFRENVRALQARLAREGIKSVVFWSEETDPRVREQRRREFWHDPECRVLIGTTTIEQSLDLQVARHLIAVDTILNPARMQQLFGRVRRQGSVFPTVYVHHLLARGTQEDGYLPLLRREQGIADAVWGENDEIFTALTPRQVLTLVARGNIAA
jgi:SNF2 family DNA or RNA helicase